MKTCATIAVFLVVMGAGGAAMAVTCDFQETDGPPYSWASPDNWTPYAPGTDDRADFQYGVSGLIDGETVEVSEVRIGSGATLTMASGSLTALSTNWHMPFKIGYEMDANNPDLPSTMNIEGGTLSIPNSGGAHGTLVVAGTTAAGIIAIINHTGGTVSLQGLSPLDGDPEGMLAICRGGDAFGYYNIGGDATLYAHAVRINNAAFDTSHGEFNISGNADVNINGTAWNSGIMLGAGATVSVTGGNASIDIDEEIMMGYYSGIDVPIAPPSIGGTSALVMEVDSTGISTINARNLLVLIEDPDVGGPRDNILRLKANEAASGIYTLFHLSEEPGVDQVDANVSSLDALNLVVDSGFDTSLTVVDVNGDGAVSGWDIQIGYLAGPVMGDVNLSTCVDDDDLSLLLANWNIGTTWGTGDLNASGNVDDDDLSLLLANWGTGCSPAPEAVPEPMTVTLLALGGLALIRRRR